MIKLRVGVELADEPGALWIVLAPLPHALSASTALTMRIPETLMPWMLDAVSTHAGGGFC
jgi:hypothetical protein